MSGDPAGRLSHYRLLEKIGQGGMGAVYRAHDTRLDRPVAVKLLLAERASDPERRRQFQQEARLVAGLNHPNICTVHEVGEVGPDEGPVVEGEHLQLTPGTPFIVMELVQGETLRDRLDRLGALPLHEVLDVASQVADGLVEAHTRQIVHRDLKPQNIALGAGGRWKILDFGLATAIRGDGGGDSEDATTVSASLHPEGRIAGTVAYMSPEQALARNVERPSDLFSFGTMLYEMASGRKPFRGETITQTIAKILESEPPRLSELRPELPAELERIVERCHRKDPGKRFDDAAALRDALARLRESVLAGTWVRPQPEKPISSSTVAVLPFVVRGDRSLAYLAEGMVDLLSTNLDGAGDLKSVDSHLVLCCGPRGDNEPDPEAAAATARGFGAGMFVLGNILEAGGNLSVHAVLYDAVDEARALARASAQGKVGDIFGLVDQLTRKLLAARGAAPSTRLTRIAAATTGSFAALKAYLEGEREMRAMRREPAAEAYRRAVLEDPEFALAWYRLAVACLWSHQSAAAWEAAGTAIRHADRLNERDRLLLQAFHALLRGANEDAERLYRTIVGTYPDDVEAWFQLGELLFHHGPQRGRTICDSQAVWERLLELDPTHLSGLVHLTAVAATTGDLELLESCSRRAEEQAAGGESGLWVRALRHSALREEGAMQEVLQELRSSSDLSIAWATRFVGVFLGQADEARPLAELLTDEVRSTQARALGAIYLANLEAAGGRFHAALQHLDQAAALSPIYALEYRALLLASSVFPADRSSIEAARAELLRMEPGVAATAGRNHWLEPHGEIHPLLRDYLAGMLSARLEDGDSALLFARSLEESPGGVLGEEVARGFADSLRAQAAWLSRRPGEALAFLERSTLQISFYFTLWSPFFAQDLERFIHAEWLVEQGRLEESLPWFSTFGENSVFDLVYFAPAHLGRARIYERLGRRDRAVQHYLRFAELWADCDDTLRARVEDARTRAGKLS